MPRWNDGVPVLCRFSVQPDSIVAKRHLPHRFRDRNVGDFIAFCLKSPVWIPLAKERGYLAPGFCPSGLRPLLKQAVGMPGDTITMEPDAIHLSTGSGSSRWPAARHEDSAGRPLPGSSLESG